MAEQPWGRFTVRGGPRVEEMLTSLVGEVAAACRDLLPPDVCRALVLLGGYGRGEGGVVITADGERPHNNLDFLAIVRAMSAVEQEQLKARLQDALASLKDEYGVELDVAVIAEARLRRSPALVMWYDMRFGHKTVLGDAAFVPSLKQFEVGRIPAWDVRNLLVNRGTLLVINDHLMASRALDPEDRRLVVKHAVKAVIGYGDALLFFHGDYHWSYAEKQQRMRARADVSQAFRDLYEQAIQFRFQPDYPAYENADLAVWMDGLRRDLSVVHLACERKRLHAGALDWDRYPEAAFRRALFDDGGSGRAWAKKVLNALRSPGRLPHGSLAARLGFRGLGARGILPVLFPVVGYHLEVPEFRALAAGYLGARNADIAEIRRAYLRMWAAAGDTNFGSVLRKWRISLEPVEGQE